MSPTTVLNTLSVTRLRKPHSRPTLLQTGKRDHTTTCLHTLGPCRPLVDTTVHLSSTDYFFCLFVFSTSISLSLFVSEIDYYKLYGLHPCIGLGFTEYKGQYEGQLLG